MIRSIAAKSLLALGATPRSADATQPDLASTEQRLEWLQAPQDEGDWASAVSAVGDLNGDGFGDVAVASPSVAVPASPGRVYIYYGSNSGIVRASEQVVQGCCLAFGSAISGAGDVDADGYDDLLVAAPARFSDDTPSAWIYRGSSAGLDAASPQRLTPSDPLPPDAADSFASAVAGAGDVDGDGYDDVVVGRVAYEGSFEPAGGAAYVYYGSPTGVDRSSEQRIPAPMDAEESLFGAQVVGAGDIDGDGYADIALGLEDGGAVYLYSGSAGGLEELSLQTLLPPPGAEPLFAQGRPGYIGLSAAGDVDADGYDDLAVYAVAFPRTSAGTGHTGTATPPATGAVLVYYGGPAGLDSAPGWVVEPTDPWDIQKTIAAAGDVDADGHDDLLVGVLSASEFWERGAYVHYGGPRDPTGLRVERIADPNGPNQNRYADTISGGVDLDGDGADDVVIGDREFGYQSYSGPNGAVFLYYGAIVSGPVETGDSGDTGLNSDTSPTGDTAQASDTGDASDRAGGTTPDTGGGCGGCSAVGSGSSNLLLPCLPWLLVLGLRRRVLST
jgi:hypothetical protein